MRRARIEPDIEDVRHLLVIGRVAIAEEDLGVGRVPRVRALALESLGDAVDDALIAQRLAAALVDEDGDRHAPGARARPLPVGARLDPRAQPPLAPPRAASPP